MALAAAASAVVLVVAVAAAVAVAVAANNVVVVTIGGIDPTKATAATDAAPSLYGFEDEPQYNVRIVGVGDGAPDGAGDVIEVGHPADGAPFACRLPIVRTKSDGRESSSDDDDDEERESVAVGEAAKHLKKAFHLIAPLSVRSFYKHLGWWSYELRLGGDASSPLVDGSVAGGAQGAGAVLRQYHVDGKSRQQTAEFVLARKYVAGSAKLVDTYLSLRFNQGDVCDLTQQPREVEVRIYCSAGGGSGSGVTISAGGVVKTEAVSDTVIASIAEPASCEYTVNVHSPTLCAHPLFTRETKPIHAVQCNYVGDSEVRRNGIHMLLKHTALAGGEEGVSFSSYAAYIKGTGDDRDDEIRAELDAEDGVGDESETTQDESDDDHAPPVATAATEVSDDDHAPPIATAATEQQHAVESATGDADTTRADEDAAEGDAHDADGAVDAGADAEHEDDKPLEAVDDGESHGDDEQQAPPSPTIEKTPSDGGGGHGTQQPTVERTPNVGIGGHGTQQPVPPEADAADGDAAATADEKPSTKAASTKKAAGSGASVTNLRMQETKMKRYDVVKSPRRRNDPKYRFVRHRVGEIMIHKKYKFRGIIIGWDPRCIESAAWQKKMQVSKLSRGARQPWYQVLVDQRDRKPPQMAYVPEEHVDKLDYGQQMQRGASIVYHPYIREYFFTQKNREVFIALPDMRKLYPDDPPEAFRDKPQPPSKKPERKVVRKEVKQAKTETTETKETKDEL